MEARNDLRGEEPALLALEGEAVLRLVVEFREVPVLLAVVELGLEALEVLELVWLVGLEAITPGVEAEEGLGRGDTGAGEAGGG